MKYLMRFVLASGFVGVLWGCATGGLRGSNQFELQAYKEVTLSNGLKVILIEDRSLPYISMNLLVRAGASQDPLANSGVATLVGELLDKGTSQHNAMELADAMGELGSSLDVSVGQDFTLVGADSLSQHREKLLKYFAEMVTESSFAEADVRRVKKQVLSALQKTVDNPDLFADVMFDSYLFGNHPYARRILGRKRDVQKLRRKSIIQYYLTYYRPNNAQLAVVGDLGPDIVGELESAFKAWASRESKPMEFPELSEMQGIQILLIDKGELAQSQIRIGHFGIKRTDPDYLKLRVANMILGGAFHSRLVDEVRAQRGLTYTIRSEFDSRLDRGPFSISTFTRHEKVGETISETLKVLQKFHDQGVSDKEVEDAKALLRGIFPRALETAEKLAQTLLTLRFYGVEDSYLTNYLDDIGRIRTKDVNEAIKKHIHPGSLKILVYSPKEKVLDQLRPQGVVEVKNYLNFAN